MSSVRLSSVLFRLGQLAFIRRRLVAGVWLTVLVCGLAAAIGFGGKIDNTFVVPGTDSQRATDLLQQTFPEASGAGAQIVFEAMPGRRLDDPASRMVVDRIVAETRLAPQVAMVVDPFTAATITPDGRIAFATVQYVVGAGEVRLDSLDALVDTRELAGQSGITVEYGGEAFTSNPAVGISELIGVLIAFAVLTIALRSFFVAGLPLIAALVGLGASMSIVFAFSGVVALSSAAPLLAVMIGLAVGVDYSLFIISRYRNELHAGHEHVDAIGRAVATSGSAVVFAGLTVFVALAALSIVGVPFLTVMGLAAAVTVVVAVLVAITLLPAMLGFSGSLVKPTTPASSEHNKWLRIVLAKPAATIGVVVVGLLLLATPARDLYLALPDNGSAPVESTQHKAYDKIASNFGAGFNGPLVVVIDQRNDARDGSVETIADDIRGVGDIATVTSPQSANGITLLQAIPAFAPDDERTKRVVSSVRALEDSWQQTTNADVYVTGYTAAGVDVSDRLTQTIVPFLAIVVGLALVVLLLVFRSIIVPIKAVIGFLLSVGAAFGATVAVFQWGWLSGPLGITTSDTTANFLPVILMAVLFGLAMDYQVFLVSRMREEFTGGAGAVDAVRNGFTYSARVVTAAALIMFAVFVSFVGNEDIGVAAIAFGLAVGILIDAFVVRMTLVPAAMVLLGDRAWWLPAAVNRRLVSTDMEHILPNANEDIDLRSKADIERRALQRALRDFGIDPGKIHVKIAATGEGVMVSLRGPVALTVVHGANEDEEQLAWRFAKRLASTPGTLQPRCEDHDHPLLATLTPAGATWSCPQKEDHSGQAMVGTYVIDLRTVPNS